MQTVQKVRSLGMTNRDFNFDKISPEWHSLVTLFLISEEHVLFVCYELKYVELKRVVHNGARHNLFNLEMWEIFHIYSRQRRIYRTKKKKTRRYLSKSAHAENDTYT